MESQREERNAFHTRTSTVVGARPAACNSASEKGSSVSIAAQPAKLWDNNSTWWCYFTLRSNTGGSKRYRISLKTHELESARAKRDRFLFAMHNASGGIEA